MTYRGDDATEQAARDDIAALEARVATLDAARESIDDVARDTRFAGFAVLRTWWMWAVLVLAMLGGGIAGSKVRSVDLYAGGDGNGSCR